MSRDPRSRQLMSHGAGRLFNAIEGLERRLFLDATLVRDISPGPSDSLPQNLGSGTNQVFFQANDGTTGTELWSADRAGLGAVLVKDINPGGNSFPFDFTLVGSTVFFVADDGVHGQELWKTDGSTSGTVMVKDIEPGADGSFPTSFVNVNGTLFFVASTSDAGNEVWKSDGTAAGTVLISDLEPGGNGSSPSDLVSFNGMCFFSGDPLSTRRELYATDGTSEFLVKDVFPGFDGGIANNGAVGNLKVAGNLLYFSATDGNSGVELWRTDGSSTFMVRDINPGPGDSAPFNLTAVGSNLFFTADTPDTGTELWKSDGTAGGTVLVRDINPGSASSDPFALVNSRGVLFFQANDGSSGEELWRADISPGGFAGASLVRDISPGPNSSGPDNLVDVGGTLFFAANDGTNGDELWTSDGTFAGTVMVANINPGSAGSEPGQLTAVGSTLFFAATEPINGRELWSLVRGLGVNFPVRVAGADAGGQPLVFVYQSLTNAGPGQIVDTIQAFDPGFTGGVRVATGDINGDGRLDVVAAAGPGAGPNVRVFDAATGNQIAGPLGSFFAYDPGFKSGVFVATGDVNGDGRTDIITGAGPGAGPHVKVFDGATGQEIRSFFAYDPGFLGGVHVAAADINGNGRADIITGAGDAAPHVKVFHDTSLVELASFFAYDPGFHGGVYVAAGDISGDGIPDIVTGTAIGPPHVKVFSGNGFGAIRSFFAYDPAFQGGVRVASGADLNIDGTVDIFTSPGFGGFQNLKVFSGGNPGTLESFLAPDTGDDGGMFVAVAR